jgi:iron complex transport system substrate-binding protein
MPRLFSPFAALCAVAVLALAGCSSSVAPAPPASDTIDNCGFTFEVGEPPERIVTIKSTTTELLLALGLQSRIIGMAFQDGPVPAGWQAAAADIPVISDGVPSQEAVLDLEPDFVFAGWESNLTADAAGDRTVLAGLGVGSYVPPSACKAEGYQPSRMTFDVLFDEFEEAGVVFGAEDAAADLIAEQRDALEKLEPSTAGLTALWYSSGKDTPYVGAGIGAPQMMLDAAGLTNIVKADDTWVSIGWESVIEANPDVIVLVDAAWNTAASKIDYLKANAATAALDAVRNDRFIIVPFAAGEAGVRNVQAVGSILEQLDTLGLD